MRVTTRRISEIFLLYCNHACIQHSAVVAGALRRGVYEDASARDRGIGPRRKFEPLHRLCPRMALLTTL